MSDLDDVSSRVRGEYKSEFVHLWDWVARQVHDNASAHGFWPPEGRNDGEMIALIHSELSECLEAIRRGNKRSAHIPCSEAEEKLADVVIRLMGGRGADADGGAGGWERVGGGGGRSVSDAGGGGHGGAGLRGDGGGGGEGVVGGAPGDGEEDGDGAEVRFHPVAVGGVGSRPRSSTGRASVRRVH